MTTVYLVSAVSYGSDHKINLLRQHEDTGGAIEKGELVERAKVASNIKKGMIYRIIRRSSKSWIADADKLVQRIYSLIKSFHETILAKWQNPRLLSSAKFDVSFNRYDY